MHEAESPCNTGDAENSDENRASDFFYFESHHEDEAEESEGGGGVPDIAQSYEGIGIADNEARMLKADEGDEQSDAAGDRCIKLMGDGTENHLADARGGESKKDYSRKKDGAEGRLPGNVHLDANCVRKVGI